MPEGGAGVRLCEGGNIVTVLLTLTVTWIQVSGGSTERTIFKVSKKLVE